MDIPNLFIATDDAERLYSIMLTRLDIHDAFAEIVRAVRKIRIHARNTIGSRAALFTYHYERDALWYLGRHAANWSQQVRHESVLYGQLLDLNSPSVEDRYISLVANQRAPLHYACGRFDESARCKEIQLALAIPRVSSEHVFYDVSNDDKSPTHPVRVTLRHIYKNLGKSLVEWSHWSSFVDGLSAHLIQRANTTHEEMLRDPRLLSLVDTALRQERGRGTATLEVPESLRSQWESELLKWFPFMQSFPSRTS